MNSPDLDIELIRKYHNGELSPKEMHLLEARALDDPFLQDALDGFEISGVLKTDIDDLNNALSKRLKENRKLLSPVWGIMHWSIAASIVFCIALGSIYFNLTPENKNIALNELQKKEDIPKSEKQKIEALDKNTEPDGNLLDAVNAEKNIALSETDKPLQNNEVYIAENDIVLEPLAKTAIKDTSISLNEVNVIGYAPQYKKDLTGAVSSFKKEELLASAFKSADKAKQRIKGKIIDENDGSALPGVSVKDTKTGTVKQTNANGEFEIETNNNSDLSISYLGYETQNKLITSKDSLIIALKPSEASLSEVVVVGYGTAVRQTDGNSTAGPKKGWKAFKDYLDTNANTINGQKGRVQVSFTILNNGELKDFSILKSMNKIADEKAISLIKNYKDSWNGSADGIAQTVRVTVKFK